jgi:hypothetical protein
MKDRLAKHGEGRWIRSVDFLRLGDEDDAGIQIEAAVVPFDEDGNIVRRCEAVVVLQPDEMDALVAWWVSKRAKVATGGAS